MHTCIYSKVSFSEAPKEHILQNFLGARARSAFIASGTVQTLFGATIDSALEEALRPFRTLLGSKSGRRDIAPPVKNLTASSGEKIHLEAGGRPVTAEPVYSVKMQPDGTAKISIKARDRKQVDWALHRIRAEYPKIKIDLSDLEKKIEMREDYIQGTVPIRAHLGTDEYFRAILKSCFNLLGDQNANLALRREFDGVREFILSGKGSYDDFAHWVAIPASASLPAFGEFSHFVGIATRGRSVEGIVSLFGAFAHSIRLTDVYTGPSFQMGYLVDPLREHQPAEDREPSFELASIPDFCVQHRASALEVQKALGTMQKTFFTRHRMRTRALEVSRIVNKTFEPYMGKPLSMEMLYALGQGISKFAVRGAKPKAKP